MEKGGEDALGVSTTWTSFQNFLERRASSRSKVPALAVGGRGGGPWAVIGSGVAALLALVWNLRRAAGRWRAAVRELAR